MLMRQREGGFLFLRLPGSRKLKKLLGAAAFLILIGSGGKYSGVTDYLSAVFSGKAGGSGAYSHELRRGASQRSAASAAEPQSSGVKEPAKPRRQDAAPEIPEKLTADYFLGLLRDDPGSAGAARGSGSGK